MDTDAAGPMTAAATGREHPARLRQPPPVRPADDGVPYVGSDSLYAGTVEMQELAELAGGKGNVVILIGDPANEAAVLRTQGCKDVVAENPGMKVTKEQSGNWYREEGLAIMENWIQSGDPIDVVCANNDEMALGAIEALKNADMLDDVLVGGVDATADALAAMQAGELEVTVFQDADGPGWRRRRGRREAGQRRDRRDRPRRHPVPARDPGQHGRLPVVGGIGRGRRLRCRGPKGQRPRLIGGPASARAAPVRARSARAISGR